MEPEEQFSAGQLDAIRQLVEEALTAKGATLLLVDEDVRDQLEAIASGIVAIGTDLKALDRRLASIEERSPGTGLGT